MASERGFHMLGLTRGNFYAHPSLLAFVRDLGKRVEKEKLDYLAIGDMSMPAGGPFMGSHGSHQSGLDVDIWFRLLPKQINLATRENAEVIVLVDKPDEVGRSLNTNWDKTKQVWQKILKMAASDPKVNRIFVNPAIKKYFCENFKQASDFLWTSKLRAWWGHHEHFHVRLACPHDSGECIEQQKPEGNGCDENLNWWWSQDYALETQKRQSKKSFVLPEMPAACKRLLELN